MISLQVSGLAGVNVMPQQIGQWTRLPLSVFGVSEALVSITRIHPLQYKLVRTFRKRGVYALWSMKNGKPITSARPHPFS